MKRLLISCADRPGIVAAVSHFLHLGGANIVSSAQHSTDPEGGRFFMRMEFTSPQNHLEQRFEADVAHRFGMTWSMWAADEPKRMAILVSRYDHCLLDLLWRWRRGELAADVGLVASNHADLRADVEAFGLRYRHVPVERDRKPEAEARLLELLAGRFDVIVLARYMQILSPEFLDEVGAPVVNIHHSFLPAFAGAGPIIEQDVIRVTHRDTVGDLVRLGADIERTVLARAVQWHCEDRVLVDGNTTVVF